jgi:hypothetical protein
MSDRQPAETAPNDKEVLVYAPRLSAHKMIRAIRLYRRCCMAYRWKLLDYPGKPTETWMGAVWQPESWQEITEPAPNV